MDTTPNDLKNLTADFVRAELQYRRDKQSTIFSWCSTILVAITGGVIFLQTGNSPVPLKENQKELLSWAIIVLVAHAVTWLGHNAHLESTAKGLFEIQVREKIWDAKSPSAGYRSAVIMLGVGALVATWLPGGDRSPTVTVLAGLSVVVVVIVFAGWGVRDYFARRKKRGHNKTNDVAEISL
jgi:hypothetical protein